MAEANSTTATLSKIDFPELVEEFRVANLHLSNMLTLASEYAQDEGESLMAAARRYANEEFAIYERLNEMIEPWQAWEASQAPVDYEGKPLVEPNAGRHIFALKSINDQINERARELADVMRVEFLRQMQKESQLHSFMANDHSVAKWLPTFGASASVHWMKSSANILLSLAEDAEKKNVDLFNLLESMNTPKPDVEETAPTEA
jgi:hypothetical protein